MTGLYRATVSYDGTDYAGFQIQKNAPSIQGAIERALLRITQQCVRIQGAGRTDAGVHAVGQVISFAADWRHGAPALERALNAVLPRDIAVRELAVAPEGFHARYSAWRREYIYRLYGSRIREPLLDRFCCHMPQPVDLASLQTVSRGLLGERDWGAFGHSPTGGSTVRRVYSAEWCRETQGCVGAWAGEPQSYVFRIAANGFLRGMVRRLVGTLLLVGTGQLSATGFQEILESCDISRVAAPAPACGLCLWQVGYAENVQGQCPSRTGADGLEVESS